MALSAARLIPPLIAAVVTVASVLLWRVMEAAGGLGGLATMIVPFVVPALWGMALLASRSLQPLLGAVVAWLIVGLAAVPGEVVLSFLAYTASGIGGGWSLRNGLRADRCLLLTLLPLALILAWLLPQIPADQMFDEMQGEFAAVLEQGLAAQPDAATRQAALATYQSSLDSFMALMRLIWPGLLLLGLTFQAAVVLLLVRLSARYLRPAVELRGLPPFHRWEVPFYLVWVLAAGLALVAARAGVFYQIGINLILIAASLLSIQGLAVQINLVGRVALPWLRVLFWAIAGVFFAPLVLAAAVLLGLFDQWLDLRKLHNVPVDDGVQQ